MQKANIRNCHVCKSLKISMYAWHAMSRRCAESKSVSLNKTRLLQKCEYKCLSIQQWRTTDVVREVIQHRH